MSGAAARFPQHYHFAVVTHLLRARGAEEEGMDGRIFLHTNWLARSLTQVSHTHTLPTKRRLGRRG